MNAVLEQEATYPEVPEWDDPAWYQPDGTLWPLEHLWYTSSRVVEVVLARLNEQEVFALCKRYGHSRQWNRIRNQSKYCNSEFIDRFFVALGMPSFHTVLGAPELASLHAPRTSDDSVAVRSKITVAQRFEIRRRRAAGERVCDLAEEYGVSSRSILRATGGGQ